MGMLVFAPAAIAKLIVGADWLQVAFAFLIWFVCLWLVLGGPYISKDEGVGWTAIMSMFFGWIGVPIVALILRAADLPGRLFS